MPSLATVTDADDPRLEPYRQVRDRDVAGRQGGFIAEGEVVLRVLARSRLYQTRSLLIAEDRIAKLAPIIAAFADEVTVFCAIQSVMDRVVGFAIHRGILGFAQRPPPILAGDLLTRLPPQALVLALFGISNHDNIGGIFRNAAAFGVDAVLLDGACCDPLYRKAIRVSVGGVLMTPFAQVTQGEDILALLQRHGFDSLALSPAGDTPLSQIARPPRAAILLGAEGPGLPQNLLARTRTITIPMAGGFDSLNVATTSGIVLHHLRRADL